jgi:hypothetical protein
MFLGREARSKYPGLINRRVIERRAVWRSVGRLRKPRELSFSFTRLTDGQRDFALFIPQLGLLPRPQGGYDEFGVVGNPVCRGSC